MRTRRVWNEHTYHITHVGEDGKVPAAEPSNWTPPGLNDYRQNRRPGSQLGAPDAIVSIAPLCGAPTYTLLATGRNLGEVPLPAGVKVGFYEAMPMPGGTKLGEGITSKVLYPAEAEKIELVLTTPPAEIVNGLIPVFAIVDDGGMPHTWHECRTDNDQSASVSGKCDGPK